MTKDPQVRLEQAIADSIHEFERNSTQMVIGVLITRIDNSYLEVGSMVIPKPKGRKNRRTKFSTGSIEVSREGSAR